MEEETMHNQSIGTPDMNPTIIRIMAKAIDGIMKQIQNFPNLEFWMRRLIVTPKLEVCHAYVVHCSARKSRNRI